MGEMLYDAGSNFHCAAFKFIEHMNGGSLSIADDDESEWARLGRLFYDASCQWNRAADAYDEGDI